MMKRLMKRIAVTFLSVAMFWGLISCGNISGNGADSSFPSGASTSSSGQETIEPITIRYCHDNNPNSFPDLMAQEFKRVIEERSNGTIAVEIYTSGQLGEGANLAELLQMGGTEMLSISTSNIATIVPEINIFDVPFLAPSSLEDAYAVFNHGKMLEYASQLYADKGMKLLKFIPINSPDWTGNKVLKSPEDFKGFKMRVMASPLLQAQYEAYGANPTSVAYSELYSALQLGVVDGQCNGLYTSYTQKFYEVQSCITRPYNSFSTDCIVVSPAWWESLPAETQELILACIDDQVAYHIEYSGSLDAEAEKAIRDYGVTVYYLTEEEREVFRDVSSSVRDTYVDIVGDNGQVMLDFYDEDYAAVMG